MLVEKSFIDIENTVEDALEIDCEFGVSFITKYDNAIVILKELLRYGETMPFFIDISDPASCDTPELSLLDQFSDEHL